MLTKQAQKPKIKTAVPQWSPPQHSDAVLALIEI